MKFIKYTLESITKHFIIWIFVSSIISFFYPQYFAIFYPYISYLLGLTMFFMGINLNIKDFKHVFLQPKATLIGGASQIIVMPTLGFLIANIFHFKPEIASGFILLGCCPGGVASNVLVYISKGNFPLSIVMTAITTLLTPITLPSFMYLYSRKWVTVNASDLFLSTLEIILIPIILGLIVNFFFPRSSNKIKDLTTPLSSIFILLIVTSMIGTSKGIVSICALNLLTGIIIYNIFAIILGYAIPHLLKQDQRSTKAICIEVAIQNGGLGASLASQHFSLLTGLPSILYAIVALTTGSLLANYFRNKNSNSN